MQLPQHWSHMRCIPWWSFKPERAPEGERMAAYPRITFCCPGESIQTSICDFAEMSLSGPGWWWIKTEKGDSIVAAVANTTPIWPWHKHVSALVSILLLTLPSLFLPLPMCDSHSSSVRLLTLFQTGPRSLSLWKFIVRQQYTWCSQTSLDACNSVD